MDTYTLRCIEEDRLKEHGRKRQRHAGRETGKNIYIHTQGRRHTVKENRRYTQRERDTHMRGERQMHSGKQTKTHSDTETYVETGAYQKMHSERDMRREMEAEGARGRVTDTQRCAGGDRERHSQIETERDMKTESQIRREAEKDAQAKGENSQGWKHSLKDTQTERWLEQQRETIDR